MLLFTKYKCTRVVRLALLTPNFTNLDFLEAVGVKKIVWLFLLNIWLFLEALGPYYQTGVLAFQMSF